MLARRLPRKPKRLDGDGPYLCVCGGVCDVTPRQYLDYQIRPCRDCTITYDVVERGHLTIRRRRVAVFRCRACAGQYETQRQWENVSPPVVHTGPGAS